MTPMWCAITWFSALFAPMTSTKPMLPNSRCCYSRAERAPMAQAEDLGAATLRIRSRRIRTTYAKLWGNRIGAGKKLVILRKRIAGLSPSTLDRFLLRARRMVHLRGTVNVLVTNSRELRSLNRRFRGKDKPTDVLSFPAPTSKSRQSRQVAGDLAISADIA